MMGIFVNPIDNEDLYDSIILGGVKSPGKVTISGHAREETWDVKEAKGSAGATTTHQGDKVSRFTATFALSDQEDFDAWSEFLPGIQEMVAGKTISAKDIFHPDLCELNITSVSTAKIGGRVHDGKGGQTIAVEFLEYRPPKPKGGSPKGSKTGWVEAKKDPNAAAKAELQAALDEAKKA